MLYEVSHFVVLMDKQDVLASQTGCPIRECIVYAMVHLLDIHTHLLRAKMEVFSLSGGGGGQWAHLYF